MSRGDGAGGIEGKDWGWILTVTLWAPGAVWWDCRDPYQHPARGVETPPRLRALNVWKIAQVKDWGRLAAPRASAGRTRDMGFFLRSFTFRQILSLFYAPKFLLCREESTFIVYAPYL